MIEVSVIIPTFKRKDSLLRLLKSLVPEMTDKYEIVVCEQFINNGSSFKSFAKKHNILLQYIFLKRTIGTSAAKNTAVKKSNGKYIIFFDDDVAIKRNCIKNLIRNFKDKKIGAVGGRVITIDQAIEENYKNVGKITFFGKFTDGFSSKIRQNIDTVIGCNCAWRKDVFEKIGGFDEKFTGAIREDSDISLRTLKEEYKILFEPDALVLHLREPTGGGRKTEGRLEWYYNFLSNETYFFLKHRPKIIVPIILATRWEWIARCMFGFGREVSIRSFITPFAGIVNGIEKYRRYSNEHRN